MREKVGSSQTRGRLQREGLVKPDGSAVDIAKVTISMNPCPMKSHWKKSCACYGHGDRCGSAILVESMAGKGCSLRARPISRDIACEG